MRPGTNSTLEDLLRNALLGMAQGPRPLKKAISFYAQQNASRIGNIEGSLKERISRNPNDGIRQAFNHQLKFWDWESSAPWTAGTKPNTRGRRSRVYNLLCLDQPLRAALDEFVPPYEGPGNVIVEAQSKEEDWYTPEFRQKYDFYWKRLKVFLANRGFSSDSLNSIDAATTDILERLPNPGSRTPRGGRGLIVGYVQSGKTTNFTSVIAKAIDAGYRLIIVLSGTTNLLRNQTQRRIDMELVGVENITRGAEDEEVEHDYKTDEGWPKRFISYGRRPGLLGRVDITRLTGQEDFESPDTGINPLEFEFEKKNKQRPLFVRENLDHAGARIAVVKKQKDRLSGLLKDLKAVGKTRCAEIPALVIDDESDQASVNTVKPESDPKDPRAKINGQIVEILHRLPRAQYLGYTATPFANVFVDLNDPEDIYPRDFILSLDRPANYMGAREFVDLEPIEEGSLSNQQAFIRSIPDPDSKSASDRLLEAIDAFVLSGALKKYREKKLGHKFKHHTMLVHQSQFQAQHVDTVARIRSLWKGAGYNSPGPATNRLQKLLEDFRNVWKDRGKGAGLPFPRDFNELKPFVGEALVEIRRGDPVLMVNAAEGSEVPNFDAKEGVWKIVVGGAKLSRGYTVEGLTISYFRRSVRMQDTLMQMGRWFGFRDNYHDLVRVYIGRAERAGKRSTLDLYQVFETMCRDEEDFRAQLAAYVKGSGVTPRDVPALVFNSHPQLRPTSRNKMFNAELTWAAFTSRAPTTQAIRKEECKHNIKLFSDIFRKHGIQSEPEHVTVSVRNQKRNFGVFWCKIPAHEMSAVLLKIAWVTNDSPIKAEIEFLRRESPVDSWIVVAPQISADEGGGTCVVAGHNFKCVLRSRIGNHFGVFTSPEHVVLARWIVGEHNPDVHTERLKPSVRTGVLLLYPTKEQIAPKKAKTGLPTMGFALTLPDTKGSQRIAFRPKDSSNPNAIVVRKRR